MGDDTHDPASHDADGSGDDGETLEPDATLEASDGLPTDEEARLGGFVKPPPEACSWAMLAHVSNLVAPAVGPVAVLALKRDLHPFVEDQAMEAINAGISVIIWSLIGFVLAICVVGVFIIMAASIIFLICTLMAAVAANKGEPYRYPYIWRYVK